jgi:hypothetical protein
MFTPYPKWICLIVILLVVGFTVRAEESSTLPDNLVVAWIDNGDLYVRAGENSPVQLTTVGDVMFPYLSPDASRIAYVQGENGLPTSLSIIDISDIAVPQPIALDPIAMDTPEKPHLNQVAWMDDQTLYFNTAPAPSYGLTYNDDLWRVDTETGEVVSLLPAGEGGMFSPSPDGNWIALANPGTYDHAEGRIRLMNVETGALQTVLSFPAVSTASEYQFYPGLFWEADSSAVRAAIPDRDLIYTEADSPPVKLWRLSTDGSSQPLGSVQAGYFGLPRWSDDANHLIFLSQVGDPADNQFDLMLAEGNGENPVSYVDVKANTLGLIGWIPASQQFTYIQGIADTYWLGELDAQPISFAQHMFAPTFLEDAQVVYASAYQNPFELRYTRAGTNQSILIATVNNSYPIFDAVLTTS